MDNCVISMIWSGLGKLGTKVITFLFSIFLARLLCPDDFGLVGMVAIFVTLATLFTDCGFPMALIRKTNRSDRDCSTVFWFQTVVSVFCYLLLFAIASPIAAFLGRPELVAITRLVSLPVVFGAIGSVAYTRLRISGRFRAISLVDNVTSVVSGSVGLLLAFWGFGVWAIVWQGIVWQLVRSVLLIIADGWLPSFGVSYKTLREFFVFGWFQFLSSVVNSTYTNIPAMLIGRTCGAADTGLYNRAQYYPNESSWLVSATFIEVVYPRLSALRSDVTNYRRSFARFALMEFAVLLLGLGTLVVFADEIIDFLVGRHWLGCVPYIRVLSIAYLLEPLRILVQQPLYVDGDSALVFRLELVGIGFGLIALFAALPYGMMAICWSRVAYTLFAFVITAFVTWKRFR